VAGKRAGIGGKRSGLFGEYIRIVEEVQPSFVLQQALQAMEEVRRSAPHESMRKSGIVPAKTGQLMIAPAISAEETESCFRRIFNGRTDEFDIEDRTDKLRALGNMVCPLQAAVALTVLARRAGIA
jgi:hypothetical protein